MLKFLKIFSVLQIALSFFIPTIFAQNRSLQFENFTIDDGLSNNSINCILQTRDGFLWIATKDGLNRFDGQNFKIFKNDPSNSKSLTENYVMSLLESEDGTFWVGTWGGGLLKFDPLHETFIRYDLPINDDDYIQALYEDNQHYIWYGTTNGGINKLNTISKKILSYRKNLTNKFYFPDNNITSITQVNKKYLWIGTLSSGLFKFDSVNETYVQYKNNPKVANSISNDYVWDICNYSNEALILSTGAGIDKFDLRTGKSTNLLNNKIFSNLNFSETFRQTIKDHNGNIWAGTYNYFGLFIFPKAANQTQNYIHLIKDENDAHSIISNRIRWLYEDRSNNIWIGTEEGISKLYTTKPFIQYRYSPNTKQTLGGKVVSSITGNNKNILWVGYAGGGFDKVNLTTNKITQYKHDENKENSLSVDDVISLYADKKGNIWIGTFYGGLNKFDLVNETFKSYLNEKNNPFSIKSNWVQQILETSYGQLLVGTNDGLQILDQQKEKFYNYSPVVKNNSEKLPEILSINALFEDREKNIWIGTWLDGLFRYDQQKQFLYHYIPEENKIYSLSASKVTSVYEDSKGFIWVGTHSGGLNKFDKSSQKFYHYTTRNGLPNDVVFGMLEDNNGSIWISTMKGLVKFNPTKETFRIYDQSDGIIHNQFNWHASYKDESGKMYFGGQNGFIKFDPNTITIDSTQIQISFTSFKVFDKEATLPQSLPTTKEIILRYDQNFFSIEFAALDLAPAHKHNYSYMLEGIDPEWINAETRTTAYYTDIEYGTYKFFVKASNADNIWSEPVVLSIIINPAWWMTWWFKVFVIIALAFIGFAIYKYRINQVLKIERIRYNIASDLHDEIGSNLSSICVDGQLLLKSKLLSENERELSSDISKTASQTLDAMRDIIWFINPKNDEGEDIIFKMRETASKLLVGMEWTFNAANAVRLDSFSLEQRRNIFLIYKEALTNVIRHSNSKKCEVVIHNQADNLIINIKDNGEGFDVNSVRKNTGLLSMMKRAEKINGRLLIESKNGIGTSVLLSVKNKK